MADTGNTAVWPSASGPLLAPWSSCTIPLAENWVSEGLVGFWGC